MYLRCDGVLDISGSTATCSQWVAVTETELLGIVVQQHQLSEQDYGQLSLLTVSVMLVVISVVFTLKTMKTGR